MASGIRMRKIEMRKPKRKYTKRIRTNEAESAPPKSTEAKRAARIAASEKLAKLAKKPKVNEELSPTKQTKASIVPQPLEAKNSPTKVVMAAVAATPSSAPALPIKPRRGRPPRIRPVPVPIETHEEPTNGGTDEEVDEKSICKKSSKKRKESDEEDCSIDVESITPSRSPSPVSPGGIVQSISSRNSGLIQVPLGPRQSFSW